jgi:hypothetical protein
MSPWLVAMLALISAGSVDTLPDRGALTGLLAGPVEGGYWQLAPRSAGGANDGIGGGFGPLNSADLGALGRIGVRDGVLFVAWWLCVTSVTTKAATATSDMTDPATMPKIKRLDDGCVATGSPPRERRAGAIQNLRYQSRYRLIE